METFEGLPEDLLYYTLAKGSCLEILNLYRTSSKFNNKEFLCKAFAQKYPRRRVRKESVLSLLKVLLLDEWEDLTLSEQKRAELLFLGEKKTQIAFDLVEAGMGSFIQVLGSSEGGQDFVIQTKRGLGELCLDLATFVDCPGQVDFMTTCLEICWEQIQKPSHMRISAGSPWFFEFLESARCILLVDKPFETLKKICTFYLDATYRRPDIELWSLTDRIPAAHGLPELFSKINRLQPVGYPNPLEDNNAGHPRLGTMAEIYRRKKDHRCHVNANDVRIFFEDPKDVPLLLNTFDQECSGDTLDVGELIWLKKEEVQRLTKNFKENFEGDVIPIPRDKISLVFDESLCPLYLTKPQAHENYLLIKSFLSEVRC